MPDRHEGNAAQRIAGCDTARLDRNSEERAMQEDRLIEIETRVAYQEHALEQLNETVLRQQKQIEQLTATCQQLAAHLPEAGPVLRGRTADEPPPQD